MLDEPLNCTKFSELFGFPAKSPAMQRVAWVSRTGRSASCCEAASYLQASWLAIEMLTSQLASFLDSELKSVKRAYWQANELLGMSTNILASKLAAAMAASFRAGHRASNRCNSHLPRPTFQTTCYGNSLMLQRVHTYGHGALSCPHYGFSHHTSPDDPLSS
jgi:hypothetical protein